MQLGLILTVIGLYKYLNRKLMRIFFPNTLKIIMKPILMVQVSNSGYSRNKSRRFQVQRQPGSLIETLLIYICNSSTW